MTWAAAVALWLVQDGELLRNADFETLTGELPSEWTAVAPAEYQKTVEFSTDAKQARRGRSAHVRNTNPANRLVNAFSQKLDGESLRAARGKAVELVVWIRTYEATVVDAWVQCLDGTEREIALHRPHAYGAVWGTGDWARFVARGLVPEKTASMLVRCVVRGMGEAWFDDLSLKLAKETAPVEPPAERDDHRKFREAASKFVLGTDREAVRAFAKWTPEEVDAALAGGLGPAPWASGYRRLSGYDVWIPAEAKAGPRPLVVVVAREKDAHKPWAEIARDMFVVRADADGAASALRDVSARFTVDADRVYTTSAAFAVAHPDRVAGVAALGERLQGARAAAPRLRGQAWWISCGDADRGSPVADARALTEEFRRLSVDHVCREHVEAGHDDLAIDRGHAIEWVSRRRRTGRVEGNTVTLAEASGAVRVWLGARQVDFAKPVRIVANGRIVFEGAVTPSFDVFLERLDATGDARATCWVRVDVRVE